MSPSRGPYADFQLGPWNSTNSVRNTNIAKSLAEVARAESNLLADEKSPQQGNQVVV